MSMGTKIKKIFPLSITIVATAGYHVNLLYITPSKTCHYVLVKDLSRLTLRQCDNGNNKRYFCQYCLHDRINEKVLKNHLGRFKLHGTERIKFPETDSKKERDKVKFTKTESQLLLPFAIYVDFESILCKQDSCEPSSSNSLTTHYQHHVPYGSCIYLKYSDG